MCATSWEHCLKASTLFEARDGTLTEDELDWNKIVSFGLDNTNAIIDNNNTVKSRILEKNASCFIAGYNYHLLHLASGRNGSAYSAVHLVVIVRTTKSISTISFAAARDTRILLQ